MKTQTSFAIVGLTRSELRTAQLFIELLRNSPERTESVLDWLEDAGDDSRLPPTAASSRRQGETLNISGATFLRRHAPI